MWHFLLCKFLMSNIEYGFWESKAKPSRSFKSKVDLRKHFRSDKVQTVFCESKEKRSKFF